jgi:hypothetical protein
MKASTTSALRLTSIAAFGIATCLASAASAQPNPFDDYERFAVNSGPAASPEVSAALRSKLKTAPWTWSLGLRSQLGFSRVTYQRDAGEPDGAATAFLLRLTPALQVFVYEKVQIGISPGLLVRSVGNNIGDDATDGNLLIEATAHYFATLSPRFSFIPGIGIGGYAGAGTRKTDTQIPDGPVVRANRGSKPSGLSLALTMGVAYQLDEHLQLRSGLSANVFFGWDHVQGMNGRIYNSAAHVGIPIELFYVF